MNFQQLRSIREAARRNFNLTEVANALHTSQPGVSRQIRELEEEMGVEIFERYGKRLTGLTPPGEEMIKVIDRLLREAENLRRVASEFTGAESGRLAIATTHTQARYALPAVVAEFRRAFPQVMLALQQASPAHIVELLRSGETDIGFASEALAQQEDFAVFEAYRWNHVVLVPKGHALTRAAQPTLEQIAEYPIITYDEGFTGRQRIDDAFAAHGLAPEIVLTAMDSDVIKTYVGLGMGIGVIAAHAFDAAKETGFTAIDGGELFGHNTALVAVRRGSYLRGYALSFIHSLAPKVSSEEILKKVIGA
ncbi:MAG: CysB family HTH-type transcriptional regulator [Candidatus Protistobacter heckmanni]|nr:CysB family HTH-type transcriptional regulator [Candidatus Protistobacter heckmanni]